MKNQFVGDINDYYKYGLLRILCDSGKKKIGVCWMLTPDDDSRAGGLTGYLNNLDKWRDYDPEVFYALHKIVLEDGDRRVKRIEEAEILRSACFFDRRLEEDSEHREDYFNEMLQHFSAVDLVFFDPDTGLVPRKMASASRHHSKWLYLDELARAFEKECSVILIQFFRVYPNPAAVTDKVQQIQDITGSTEIHSYQAGKVAFFLVAQRKHVDFFRRQAREVKKRWKSRIIVTPDPDREGVSLQ